jgi:hypothetical protein
VNLLGDNIDTTNKNKETLIDASKEVGLEINVEKTKYMLLSHHQNLGQNQDIKIANRFFENVLQLKYLGTRAKNQNLVQDEIKRRLNSAFENRVLRRIFEPKRDEVMGGWKKLHNEVLHDLYSLTSIIRIIKSRRRMRWAGYVARMGKKRNKYRFLVGKPEGKRPLGRIRHR